MMDPTSTDTSRPPPGDGRRSRWWRSAHDRYLGGVAGGFGERFDVDPLFVRLGLVIVTLVTASGDGSSIVPLLYGFAWLVLPVDGGTSILARLRHEHDARREAAGIAALVLATVVLLPRLGPGGSTGLRFGVVLFGIAVLLLASRGDDGDGQSAVGDSARSGAGFEPGPTTSASEDPWSGRSPFGTALRSGWTGRTEGRRQTAPGRRRRRPVRAGPALWPLTIALLAIYSVACFIVDDTVAGGLRPGLAVSGALLIVGGVLVLSAWKGRARSTILIGLALLPAWIAFSPSNVDRFDGSGERVLRPDSIAAASGRHELGYGLLEVDLTDLKLQPGEVLRTGVALTGGVARVIVPADTDLVIRGPIGLGHLAFEGSDFRNRRDEIVINQSLNRRYGPQPRDCNPSRVPVGSLRFGDGEYAGESLAELTAALERREWTPPSAPQRDQYTGEETVIVATDNFMTLCDDSLPEVPPNPATVFIDVDLGLADLEVRRVSAD